MALYITCIMDMLGYDSDYYIVRIDFKTRVHSPRAGDEVQRKIDTHAQLGSTNSRGLSQNFRI